MGELEKILIMINRCGYLNLEQIALLLNKNQNTIETQLKNLRNKKLIITNKLTRKNIYVLTHKWNSYLGRVHKKVFKLIWMNPPRQDVLIKWLCRQTDIEHYQTEREIKMENGNPNAHPDLIVYKTDGTIQLVKLKRTHKTTERFKKNSMVSANTIKTTTKSIELCQHKLLPIELKHKSITMLDKNSIAMKSETNKKIKRAYALFILKYNLMITI